MRALPVLLALAMTQPMMAQSGRGPTPVSATPRPPVDQVGWMLGEWEGPATYNQGGGSGALRQTERVELVSGGSAIAVRGRGFERSADGSEKVIYEAFAVLYKNRDGTLGFRAWNQEGQFIDPVIELRSDGLVWSFDNAAGMRFRYTTVHTPADEWHEIGEWSRDGTTWNKFMEMRLNRVPGGRLGT
jgi:hypothetical protein